MFTEAAMTASTFALRIGKKDLLIYDRFIPETLDMCLTIVNGLGVVCPVVYGGFYFSKSS